MLRCLVCFFVIGLTGLTHLDLFGARITDSGTNHLRSKSSLLTRYTLLLLLPELFGWFCFDNRPEETAVT